MNHQEQHIARIPYRTACGLAIAAIFLVSIGCSEEPELTGLAGALQNEFDGSNDHSGHDHTDDGNTTSPEEPRPVPSETPPWPTATVEESEFNFGRMQLGAKDGEHRFTIANTGNADLELVTGETTCQCTKFELSTDKLAPGESAILTVSWKVAKVDPNFSHGGSVYTNDPKRTDIRFTIAGMIDASVTMKPDGLWHAGLLGEEPVTFEADIFSRVIEDLTISSASMQTEYCSVDWEELKPIELSRHDAESGFRFTITVRPDFPVGTLEDRLTVNVDQLDEPLEIPVHATRQGAIHITGMKGARFNSTLRGLDLGRFPASKGREAQLMLIVAQKNFNEELKLTNVESDPKAVRVALEPIGKPSGTVRRYALTVRVPPGVPRMKRLKGNSATIHCETNHPSGEDIDLLVRIDSF